MKGALRIVILCSFVSLGMGSCSQTVELACTTEIPQLQKDFAQARQQLSDEIAKQDVASPNRSLASVEESSPAVTEGTPHRFFELAARDKSTWEDWSTQKLKQVERYLDFARTEVSMDGARGPLSDLSERLVDFDGYTGRGELYQMRESLGHAQEDLDTAVRLGCAAYNSSSRQ